MITVIFLLLVVLSIFHFIYEGIIVPSLRLKLEYMLFSLRDELRMVKISKAENIDPDVFHYLQETVNNLIAVLPSLQIQVLFSAHQIVSKDNNLRKLSEERKKKIKDADIKVVKTIVDKISSISLLAILINHGGTSPYLIPIFILLIVAIVAKPVGRLVYLRLLRYLQLFYLPEDKVAKIIPPTGMLPT